MSNKETILIGRQDEFLLTRKEACQLLRISDATIHRLLKTKSIPAYKIGRHWKFIKSELLEWVKSQGND